MRNENMLRGMWRKVLAIMLCLILVMGLLTMPVSAQGLQNDYEYDGSYDEIVAAFSAEQKMYLQPWTMRRMFCDYFKMNYAKEDIEVYENIYVGVTWREFLKAYSVEKLPFVLTIGNTSYFIGTFDEYFPEQLWAYAQSRLNCFVTVGEMRLFMEASCAKWQKMLEYKSISSVEELQEYAALFDVAFPNLVEDMDEAVAFWLEAYADSTAYQAGIRTIMHELQHEKSATLSNAFKNRYRDDGRGITWSCFPGSIYFLDLMTNEWVSVKTAAADRSVDIVTIPDSLLDKSYVDLYYNSTSSMSNNHGCYGQLSELISYLLGLTVDVNMQAANVNRRGNRAQNSTDTYLVHAYFMYAYFTNYMASLKEKHRSVYDEIMSDENFVKVAADTLEYAHELFNQYYVMNPDGKNGLVTAHVTVVIVGQEDVSDELNAMIQWAESDAAQLFVSDLSTKYIAAWNGTLSPFTFVNGRIDEAA